MTRGVPCTDFSLSMLFVSLLAVWKLIDIAIWLFGHISIGWKS